MYVITQNKFSIKPRIPESGKLILCYDIHIIFIFSYETLIYKYRRALRDQGFIRKNENDMYVITQ
ncbi:hypothetical protein ACC44_00575, partial [Francisella tularensis subsp. holarctica]